MVALGALTACAADDDSSFAERQELANTSPFAAMAKSPARSVTRTFEQICLQGSSSVEDRTARLRAAGFVPAGGWRMGVRDFVTNDLRPAVRLSRDGRMCAVRARATTGQNVAAHDAIRGWFPQARQIKATDAQEIWETGRIPGEGVGVARNARGAHENEIMLALIQL